MSKRAAGIVADQIASNPKTVLGLATGSTIIGMYKDLVERFKRKEIDFSNVTTFNLDEYYKLERNNKSSYYTYMMENFFEHINVPMEQVHIPNGITENIYQDCLQYEQKIAHAGGIDLQVLGIGANGHIGFNEPSHKLDIITHLVSLTQETIRDNSRFFESKDDVPTRAITMGMGTIMRARKIILLANGENKAEAIKNMTNGYINTQFPSSILQVHRDMTLILDRGAASLIKAE